MPSRPLLKPAPRARSPTLLGITMNSTLGTMDAVKDDLLRVAGSLKLGRVTASLFIAKLQSFRRQNVLTRALQEYGRLNKTIFILCYLLDEHFQLPTAHWPRKNIRVTRGSCRGDVSASARTVTARTASKMSRSRSSFYLRCFSKKTQRADFRIRICKSLVL